MSTIYFTRTDVDTLQESLQQSSSLGSQNLLICLPFPKTFPFH